MNPKQSHQGGGDNIGRDKNEQHHYHGKEKDKKFLTGLPELQDELIGRDAELAELYNGK